MVVYRRQMPNHAYLGPIRLFVRKQWKIYKIMLLLTTKLIISVIASKCCRNGRVRIVFRNIFQTLFFSECIIDRLLCCSSFF